MKQLVVEIADDDMRVLEKVAKHRARDPAELLREQVNIFVAVQLAGTAEWRKPTLVTDQKTARERRLQILRRTSGLMKNEPSFPKDGLQYQAEIRAEWA